MEANVEALNVFMSARPAQNGGNESSYLAWIKSRYPQENISNQVTNVDDDWRQDFEVSNVPESTVQGAEAVTDAPVEDGALESIDLASSTTGDINTLLHAMSFNSPVKVDNFYIDGEEIIQEPDLAFYMPSGMKDTAVIETDPVHDGNGQYHHSALLSRTLHDCTVKNVQQEGLVNDLTVTDMDFDEDGNGEENEQYDCDVVDDVSAGADNVIETLYFSGDEEDEHTLDGNNDKTADLVGSDNTNNGLSHAEMVAALVEFQKFSPRYRDINSALLLQAIQPSTDLAGGGNSTAVDEQGGVTRWYDDVEEFSPVI